MKNAQLGSVPNPPSSSPYPPSPRQMWRLRIYKLISSPAKYIVYDKSCQAPFRAHWEHWELLLVGALLNSTKRLLACSLGCSWEHCSFAFVIDKPHSEAPACLLHLLLRSSYGKSLCTRKLGKLLFPKLHKQNSKWMAALKDLPLASLHSALFVFCCPRLIGSASSWSLTSCSCTWTSRN